MITRARRGIIVIGDRRTLRYDNVWGTWLAWAENRGLVQGESAKRNGYKPRLLADTMLGDVSLEQYLNLEVDNDVVVESTTDGGWTVSGSNAVTNVDDAEQKEQSVSSGGDGKDTKVEAAKESEKESNVFDFDDVGWEGLMDAKNDSDSDSDSDDYEPFQAPKPAPVKTAPVVLKVVKSAKASSPSFGRRKKSSSNRPVSPSQEKYFPAFVKNYDVSLVPELMLPLRAEDADAALQDENERLLLQSEKFHGNGHKNATSLRHGQVKLLTKGKKNNSNFRINHGKSSSRHGSNRNSTNNNNSFRSHRGGLVITKAGDSRGTKLKSRSSSERGSSGSSSNGQGSGMRHYGNVRIIASKEDQQSK
jgi:hypothetical protein